MNLLTSENISKSYGEKILLDKISLVISEEDKVGLIGINGTGKSTLLKIIAGVEESDGGSITMGNNLRIEYLPQNPEFNKNNTVLQYVFDGHSPILDLAREYESTLIDIEKFPGDSILEKKLAKLTQRMDDLNAWSIESEAKKILTKLGIFDYAAEVGTLSGGERKRVAIARALISPANLLILDEPTNHIDNETVDWMEEYLNNRQGALLMVTHDRYFLDRVANKIIELDRGQLYSYTGNYSLFLEKKLNREELERASERKRQSILRNELEWIKKGAKARSTKQKARIERFENLQTQELNLVSDKIEIVAGSSRLGRKIIELVDVCKGFEDKELITNFNYTLLRDDRIGIIGPNGSGKSTLLKLIMDKLQPDSGTIEVGQTVKIALFSQENDEINEELRVIEYIREEAEFLETPAGTISASQMLERFLFPSAVQWTPIQKLSGGEKRKLYLLRKLMGAPNVLLLDEPTNDLDIQTLGILEEYIDEFPGAVIVVSHDRYFLDRIAEKIFVFEDDGIIHKHIGNYSDYRDYYNNIKIKEKEELIKVEEKKIISEKQNNKPINKPTKLSYKEQKEFEQIDGVIEDLEKQLKDIGKKINEGGSDYELLQELAEQQISLEEKLESVLERWVYLNELQEQIDKRL